MIPDRSQADLDALVRRFEAHWTTGAPPRLADFLPEARHPAWRQIALELIKIDLEKRWAQRRQPCPLLEQYLERYPALGCRGAEAVDLIAEEYWVRQHWGDRPSHQEYLRRFPDCGLQLVEKLREIDAELASEYQGQPARLPVRSAPMPTPGRSSPPVQSTAQVLASLKELGLVESARLQENPQWRRIADPRLLGRELIQKTDLTPYQLNQLLQGRARELVVGPYVLLERLAQGGTGQVYKARHVHMKRVVALKLLHKELLTDPEALARFRREIEVISQLTHPNVVRAYDAGPIGAGFFLVTELIEGVDLQELVAKQGPLAVASACEYARQAALGLQHIHERGLVHRDIKPANLLLAGNGRPGAGEVKILDLGLARLLRPVNDPSANLTGVGGVMIGTLNFMAPEQALDFHAADIRADIYSLGCTLYYLLTGQPPFPEGTLAEKLMAHQQREPAPLEQHRRDVPPGLTAVLQRMMAKPVDQRFPCPEEAAQALAGFCPPSAVRALVPVRAAYPLAAVAQPAVIDAEIVPRPGGSGLARTGNWLARQVRTRPRWALGFAAVLLGLLVLWLAWPASTHRKVYLSDLPEQVVAIREGTGFGKNGQLGEGVLADPNAPKAILVNGVAYPKGIAMCPPIGNLARVRYALDGRYRYFHARAGVNQTTQFLPNQKGAFWVPGKLVFQVIADGQTRWQSTEIERKDQFPQEALVDVSGVQTLELVISFSANSRNYTPHPVWGDPYVTTEDLAAAPPP